MSTYRTLIPTWQNDFTQWIWQTRCDTPTRNSNILSWGRSEPACTFQTHVGNESPLKNEKYGDCCWPGLHSESTETCYWISSPEVQSVALSSFMCPLKGLTLLWMQSLVTLQQRQPDRQGTINYRDHPLTTRSAELSNKNNKPRMFTCSKNMFVKLAHILNL